MLSGRRVAARLDGGDPGAVTASAPERRRVADRRAEQAGQLIEPVVAELGDVGPYLPVIPRLVLARDCVGAPRVVEGDMGTEPGECALQAVEPVGRGDSVSTGSPFPSRR